jgi:PII-like signaling protein
MKGCLLRFYLQENRKHGHILLYEWLLEQAKKIGIHGGSAFRAIAGFGRHGKIHEQHFFELAGDLTVQVDFLVNDEDADRLIDLFRRENIHVVFARIEAEIGVINADER